MGQIEKMRNNNDPIAIIMCGYIGAAKCHKIKFTLTYRTFKRLIFKNCFYCGGNPEKIFQTILYNGIVRKDVSKGYIQRNTIPCCRTCISMKTGLSHLEFLAHIQKIK